VSSKFGGRSAFHVHFTSTYGSWLNLVERWFAELTNKHLRRGVHRSVAQLTTAIREFIAAHHSNPKPFIWTKSADEILAALRASLGERSTCRPRHLLREPSGQDTSEAAPQTDKWFGINGVANRKSRSGPPRSGQVTVPSSPHVTNATPRYGYRTRVITDGVEPSLHIEYKHSHLKQYFKEGHGLRSQLTINNPNDFGFTKGLDRLPALRALGDDVNRTLLTIERVSQHCTLTTALLDRLQQPLPVGQLRISALRFGEARIQALCQALSGFAHLPAGFRQAINAIGRAERVESDCR
jgi:hypothetical protein